MNATIVLIADNDTGHYGGKLMPEARIRTTPCYSVKKGETNRKTAVNVIYLTRMIEQNNLYF